MGFASGKARLVTKRAARRQRARLATPAQSAVKPATVSALDWRLAMAAASRPPVSIKFSRNPFAPAVPSPGVLPAGMALDSALVDAGEWAAEAYGGSFEDGMYAMPFPRLAILAQRPEYRRISEVIATEMTRKGIKFHATGDDDKGDTIKAIEDAFREFNVGSLLKCVAMGDGLMGRHHIFVDLGDASEIELTTPIGDGRDAASLAKVRKGALKGFRTVEAMWAYPNGYDSRNPLSGDFYRPQSWFVQGRQVHASRLLTFVGREVPDILKPAYAFAGVSLSQMAQPYVENWLRTRKSVSDLISAFSIMVLKTPMDRLMATGGDQLVNRLAFFNQMRDNRGLMAVDKETEELANVSAPLGGLEALQAQAQEHLASISGIPLVKLLGIQPAGLNSSSDGEIRCFYDWIHASQESLFRPNLERIINLIQLHLFGRIDDEITFSFEPLWSMSELEAAQVRKTHAETGQILIDGGTIAPAEERQRIADDPDTPYHGLDVEDVPDIGAELDDGEEAEGHGAAHSLLGRAAKEQDDAATVSSLDALFDRARSTRSAA